MSIHKRRKLYEDDDLLAIDKLSGELVVKGKGKVQKLPLLDLLQEEYPDLRTLHRLDFETSGVVLFAKTKQAYDAVLDSNFAGWIKVYQALVMGRVGRKQGVIRAKLPARGKGMVDATSSYTALEQFVNSSYVEVQIETGRHHQIRKHFAHINHPLVLDDEYGHRKFNKLFAREFGYKRFFLHAKTLELPHPVTGEQLKIEAKLPKKFTEVLNLLRSI